MKKHIAPLLILLVLCSMLLRVKTVESAPDDLETFYILSDGSVSPATPLIVRIGDLYSLAGNISAIIIVQKSGITFDGNGYTLYGNNTYYGAVVSAFAINGVDNITIRNTRIINYTYGVFLQDTMYNNIANNYFDYNSYAVRLYGEADFNTIANNTMTRGTWGVGADYNFNDNSTIIYNNITNLVSGGVGINLQNSAGNVIHGNTMDHNNKGVNLYKCTNSVVSGNIMTYMDQAGIHLTESNWNTITDNKINRTQYGPAISVDTSSNNSVCRNTLWFNENGIGVKTYSTLNAVFGNNLTYNDGGIVLYNHANNNTFYHNNFVTNSPQVFFQSSDNLNNKWNSTTEGNYWSDYNGTDSNSDGIGDTPYQINTENIDYYPLVTPFQRQPHEVTLLSVSTSKVLTRMGKPVIIDVMVENTGDYPETFNVTVYAENIVIGTKLVSLDAQMIEKVSFLWQTGGFQPKNYVIRSTITGFSQEMQVINNGMGSMQPMTVMGDGCWILVAGSILDDELRQSNHNVINYVYRILREVGYTSDEIYLMHQTQYSHEDIDGDGLNDVDANATWANLRWAIESWASTRTSASYIEPLYIYLLDHGGFGYFCINPYETVYATDIENWISNLKNATNATTHVIYAACHSGSFIFSLSSSSGRIIVTSCKDNQLSYVYGYDRFSVPFWNSIKSGHSIMDAFNYACQTMASTQQTPLLDDNGDKIGHCGYLPNNGDGALAANTYIGHCEWPYPWVSYAIAKQTFTWPPPSSVTLWAKVENKTNLTHVAVYMQPPDWIPPDPNGTIVVPNFERFEMTDPDHDGNWTVNIPSINFTSHASGASKFIFLIMAEEENGNTATPEIIEVEFTASGSPSDDTEAPKVYVERPLEESVVYGMIEINGTAADDACLQKVELYIGNNLVDTLNLASYSVSYFTFHFNTTTLENGATEILLKVFDSTGNTSNQSLTVYVNNFVHDVVVTDLTPSSTLVNQGEAVNVSVTVANYGAYTETLNVTVYANTTALASHVLILEPGNFAATSFIWNTTGFANGNYTLNAKISPVTGEVDTTNNDLTLTETLFTLIPEFPSAFLLPFFMALSVIAVAFAKKTRKNKGSPSKTPPFSA